MSVRKYRLAAPTDSDQIDVLYRPTSSKSSSLPHRFTTLNNIEANRTLLDNKPKVAEIETSTSHPRWWLVLPCLILMTFVTAGDTILLNDLIIRRYERRYGFNSSPGGQRQDCLQSMTTPRPVFYWQFQQFNPQPTQHRPDHSIVQRAAASFHTKNSIVALIPGLVTFIFLGSNCDIIGRRPLLVLPFVGKVIWYSLLLVIVLRDLADPWLLAAHAIESVFGSVGLVALGAFSYITDCTSGPTRTRAFLLTEGTTFLTRVVPILALGVWLRFYLYTVPLSICLGFSVLGLIYTFFVQPESVESVRNTSFIRQLALIRLTPIVRVVKVFIVKRAGNNRQRLALITIVLILLQSVLLGYLSVFALYLYGRPMCSDALHVSLLASAQAVTTFLLSIGTAVSKVSFDHTYLAPIFGSLAVIVKLVILSLAKRVWLLYIAVCIGSLFFITLPVLRSKLTGLVEINEYGIVFIGAGIIEALGHSLVGAVANAIYNASVGVFPGLIFSIFALVALLPILLMCYLAFSDWRASRNGKAKATPRSEIQT